MPYNPHQNGVSERKNRTICEAAKAMMFDKDLPNFLWAEATSTTMYIQNRCPHAILKESLNLFSLNIFSSQQESRYS
jgi:hypothetical protein